jgi:hypothetical protein
MEEAERQLGLYNNVRAMLATIKSDTKLIENVHCSQGSSEAPSELQQLAEHVPSSCGMAFISAVVWRMLFMLRDSEVKAQCWE